MYMDALAQRPMLTKSVTCFVGELRGGGVFFLSFFDGQRKEARPFFVLTSFSISLLPDSLSLSLLPSTGGVLGDLLAQQTTGLPFDAARNLRLATFGLVFGGPAGHLWHRALDARFVAPAVRGSASQFRVVFSKLACDQLLFAPLATALLFVFLKVTEGGTPVEAAAFCAENWWRTLKVEKFFSLGFFFWVGGVFSFFAPLEVESKKTHALSFFHVKT